MLKNLPENKPKPRPQNPVQRKALQRGARRNKHVLLILKATLLSNCNPLHCFKPLFHYHFRSGMLSYDHVAVETKLSVE